jgi:hypothetical protein
MPLFAPFSTGLSAASWLIPKQLQKLEFDRVGSATHFSSSLVPCPSGNGHSLQTKNLCSLLVKPQLLKLFGYTCSSIACEAALKTVKKIIKNRHMKILG